MPIRNMFRLYSGDPEALSKVCMAFAASRRLNFSEFANLCCLQWPTNADEPPYYLYYQVRRGSFGFGVKDRDIIRVISAYLTWDNPCRRFSMLAQD
jgi:hypothetical protein